MVKDNYILSILSKTASDCNVNESVVEDVIDTMYSFISNKITEHDYKQLSIDEVKRLKKNFNIPALGKLYVNEKVFNVINKLENE